MIVELEGGANSGKRVSVEYMAGKPLDRFRVLEWPESKAVDTRKWMMGEVSSYCERIDELAFAWYARTDRTAQDGVMIYVKESRS